MEHAIIGWNLKPNNGSQQIHIIDGKVVSISDAM